MTGLTGMDKKCWASSAGQGGGDLVTNMTGLAHPQHHNAAAAVEHVIAGAGEVMVDAAGHGLDGLGFVSDYGQPTCLDSFRLVCR